MSFWTVPTIWLPGAGWARFASIMDCRSSPGAAAGLEGLCIGFSPAPGSPCYGCLEALQAFAPQNCLTQGILGPVVNMVGQYQAHLTLLALTGLAPVPWGELARFNGTGWQHLQLPVNPACTCCQHHATAISTQESAHATAN